MCPLIWNLALDSDKAEGSRDVADQEKPRRRMTKADGQAFKLRWELANASIEDLRRKRAQEIRRKNK
jgi:hypothetical protein